jgi:CxxC-x17-CxxC domain-containing protein
LGKKTNLKSEKAKRNKEYALKFKKSRRPGRPARSPRFSEGSSEGSSSGPGGSSPMPRVRSMTLFTATCSSCGSEAKLPFEPTSGKPVFCDNCFQKQPR